MNHIQILRQAWNILWSYRALWIFGILLALTTPSGNPSDNVRYEVNDREMGRWNLPAEFQDALDKLNAFFSVTSPEKERTVITLVIAGVVIGIILAVLGAIVHYVSQTALLRMVDQYESSGQKASWRQGFRLGWSRTAWRLFLVNLVVYSPIVLVFFVLFGCAALPAIMAAMSGGVPTWSGVVATIGLAFLTIFLLILVTVALSMVMEIINRVVVLQETGIMEGIRQGWQIARRNFKDVFILWLILVGIQLGFAIVLVPVLMVFGVVGLLVGGGSGFGLYYLAQTLTNPAPAIIGGVILGGALFLVLVGLPLLFLGGLRETYLSTVWTLTYRALTAPAALIALPGIAEENPALPE